MVDHWIVTPQFFDKPEPSLVEIAPKNAIVNGPHTIQDRTAASMALLHKPIADFVFETLQAGKRPISIAGDCCSALPVLAGIMAAKTPDPVLVWLDAHGDFNTPQSSTSQFLGGMPLAMIAGRGPQLLCDSVGLKPLAENKIWLIDGRDLDPAERVALDNSAIRRTGMAGLATLKIENPVYVHLDIDVINSADAPANNYPVSGGPSLHETITACRDFALNNNIIAISISGWVGALDHDGRTKNACAAVIAALTGK